MYPRGSERDSRQPFMDSDRNMSDRPSYGEMYPQAPTDHYENHHHGSNKMTAHAHERVSSRSPQRVSSQSPQRQSNYPRESSRSPARASEAVRASEAMRASEVVRASEAMRASEHTKKSMRSSGLDYNRNPNNDYNNRNPNIEYFTPQPTFSIQENQEFNRFQDESDNNYGSSSNAHNYKNPKNYHRSGTPTPEDSDSPMHNPRSPNQRNFNQDRNKVDLPSDHSSQHHSTFGGTPSFQDYNNQQNDRNRDAPPHHQHHHGHHQNGTHSHHQHHHGMYQEPHYQHQQYHASYERDGGSPHMRNDPAIPPLPPMTAIEENKQQQPVYEVVLDTRDSMEEFYVNEFECLVEGNKKRKDGQWMDCCLPPMGRCLFNLLPLRSAVIMFCLIDFLFSLEWTLEYLFVWLFGVSITNRDVRSELHVYNTGLTFFIFPLLPMITYLIICVMGIYGGIQERYYLVATYLGGSLAACFLFFMYTVIHVLFWFFFIFLFLCIYTWWKVAVCTNYLWSMERQKEKNAKLKGQEEVILRAQKHREDY